MNDIFEIEIINGKFQGRHIVEIPYFLVTVIRISVKYFSIKGRKADISTRYKNKFQHFQI